MNLIGSKTIETKRLILRSSKMEEQKRLWEILMIPEVNKWYLVGFKKHANNSSHWTWENQEKFYISKVDKADNNDVFVWSVFLKPEYTNSGKEEVIGQVSAQENGEVDYTDSFGVFDLNRKKIVECLIKNHDYNEKSEVGEYRRSIAK